MSQEEIKTQLAISKLEEALAANPDNFKNVCKSAELYLQMSMKSKCLASIAKGVSIFKEKGGSITAGFTIIEVNHSNILKKRLIFFSFYNIWIK